MNTWSQQAWEAALPVYRKILEHPFVNELASGELPEEKFRFYLQQDSLYLAAYSRVLSHIASRLTRREHVAAFVRFASDGIAVEEALHRSYLKQDFTDPQAISPACLLYTSLLGSQATAPVEVEAAAVLPCFWVYQQVGRHILALQKGTDNPYRPWILTYADPVFEQSTAQAIALCDHLAECADPSLRERMSDIFVLCTRMEWMFWDSAYRMEGWPV